MDNRKEILEKLKQDEHYYGEFGKQFLSNSDIQTLLSNPLALRDPQPGNVNFLLGGYFHTSILEPDKLDKFKIIESTTRNTKLYKEISGGEICLLQHEVDKLELLKDKLLDNEICKGLIIGDGVNDMIDYEQPSVIEIGDNMWKGKALSLIHI